MIRRPGLSSQSHDVFNGSKQRGDPPASTLAAQIVDRISTTSREAHSANSANFEQLLLEISRSTASGNVTTELDTQVNCRLVYVVTEAGLGVLLTDDPFANWDLQLSQALKGLTIIELTIKRAPDILFLNIPDEDAPPIPLFIWLFPRILSFTGVQKYEVLQDKLGHVLSTACSATTLTPTFRPRCGPLLQYMHDCVGGTRSKRMVNSVVLTSLSIITLPRKYRAHFSGQGSASNGPNTTTQYAFGKMSPAISARICPETMSDIHYGSRSNCVACTATALCEIEFLKAAFRGKASPGLGFRLLASYLDSH